MKQNDNRIFRKEDLDWKTLETIGIHQRRTGKKRGHGTAPARGGNGNRPIENPYSRTPLNNGRHPQDHGGDGRKAGNGNQRDQSRSGKRSRRIIPAPYRQNQKYTQFPRTGFIAKVRGTSNERRS